MENFLRRLDRLDGFSGISSRLDPGLGPISVAGLVGSSRRLLAAWLGLKTGRNVLFVSQDQETAEQAYDDLIAFSEPDKTLLFPSWEIQPYEIRAPHAENVGDRLKVLHQLMSGEGGIICTSGIAIVEPTADVQYLTNLALSVAAGDTVETEFLIQRLVEMGFRRQPVVEQLGDFAVRGGLIDLFPATGPEPIRMEFFGDRVESIRTFSVLTQRSLSNKDLAVVLPLREIKIDVPAVENACESLSQEQAVALHQALGPNGAYDGLEFFRHLFTNSRSSLLDHLHPDTVVVIEGREEIRDVIDSNYEKAALRFKDKGDFPFGNPGEIYFDYEELKTSLSKFAVVELGGLLSTRESTVEIGTRPQEAFGPHARGLAEKLKEYREQGYIPVIYCDGAGRKKRLGELLAEYDVEVPMVDRRITSGFAVPDGRLWFLSDGEMFSRAVPRKKVRRFKEGIALSSYQSLQPGDYVVHIDFGIGKYRGLETLTVDGRNRDCLSVVYAEGDRVYVPIEEFSRVQKFAGREGSPTLSRIGSGAWERTKARARKAIMEMARELIELYARRRALPGFAFGPDTQWQKELEASFEYEETPDQRKAIDDIKADMESSAPMDRLVCGDVGYGKTEVAIRAAFKAVESGKQVVVLAPTTILAQQHLNTFKSRLEPFPVIIELLSRFRSSRDSGIVREGLKKGTIDIVVGTHKLLSRNVEFKNLGLLIVDEEQRFGVAHKEKIRKLKTQVDTLTLTATPIPRTLQLSLLGARDMSVINTPPRDRLSIKTEVSLFSDRVIVAAVERELMRGGQIFFVHNRVESIEAIYRYLRKLLPLVKIIIGHGQMPEKRLEKVMVDFLKGEYQLLLSTTIIESGLDIPSVNTIIVNRSDKLGLAQLYQLRGRVGRSSRKAYAHLLIPPLKLMSDKARKRLRAIEEFTELGSGFHLAMRDLEIRGAGNILGPQQHGFIEEVGFDLYCRLLEEAVAELKEKAPPREKIDIKVQTDLDLFIPESYVADSNLRVELYRKIFEIDGRGPLQSYKEELIDRFGPFPEEVENLMNLAESRVLASSLGARRLIFRRGELYLEFPVDREFTKEEIEGWRQRVPWKMEFDSADGLVMRIKPDGTGSECLKNTLQSLVG